MSLSLSSPEFADARLAGIRLSDRLLQRASRVVARRPYFTGSIAAHGLLALLLLNVDAFDAHESAQAAAAEAATTAQRVAQTQARDLQHRIERMQAVLEELAPGARPLPPGTGAASPATLAQQAQRLADAIDAADRDTRAADLARLTQLTPAQARRKLALDAAAQALPPPPETAAQKISRLERRTRDIAQAHRARADAQREGLRVTSATTRRRVEPGRASAHTDPVSGSTGQTHVADGIPRSMAEQFKAMVRLGGPQGRVGVVGTESGLSINREHVRGLAGGRNATADDFGPDSENASQRRAAVLDGQHATGGRGGDIGSAATQAGGVSARADLAQARGTAAVRIPGMSLDLTGNVEDGHHQFVRYAAPAAVGAAALRTGAGRVFGAGGAYAQRVYLDTWYVIGPFAGKGDESMQTAYPPEDDVDLDAVYPGPDGRALTWRFTSRGFYPFIPPERRPDGVWYAWTELRVDDDQDVWLAIAADHDSLMWLDERLVWVGSPGDKPWYHPPYYLRDELVGSLSLAEGQRRVHLSAGVHRLLFKLHEDGDRAFFSVVLSR